MLATLTTHATRALASRFSLSPCLYLHLHLPLPLSTLLSASLCTRLRLSSLHMDEPDAARRDVSPPRPRCRRRR